MVTDLQNPIQFKGGLYPLTSLVIYDNNLDSLDDQLKNKIRQAPNFFKNTPIIIDLKIINNKNIEIDLKLLKKSLNDNKFIPVAVKNANQNQRTQAIANGLAVMKSEPNPKENLAENILETIKTSAPTQIINSITKIITDPVRSGEQICAPNGDLIILGPVGHGAEILATGNIHIYNTLRGRALAGIGGDKNARIFCKSLEAELVSIAGEYKISEDIEKKGWKIPAEISLKDNYLQIKEI